MKALLDTSFPTQLSLLLQTCIRRGQTLTRWNKSLIYLIYKNTSLQYIASNTRPLCILVKFRRVFEGLLLPMFEDTRFAFNNLYSGQGEFRGGYSTLTHTMTVYHALEHIELPIVIFLDLEATYDKVGRAKLLTCFERQGMPPILIQLILQLMLDSMTHSLVVNGEISTPHVRQIGLPQGSPLSPVIFNQFIDSLVRGLNTTVVNETSLSSASFIVDDRALLCQTWMDASKLVAMC